MFDEYVDVLIDRIKTRSEQRRLPEARFVSTQTKEAEAKAKIGVPMDGRARV